MSKKEIRPFWTTTVDPSEYNYRKQFSQAVKIANERKEVFPPLDIGKVWGLVESHARLERENAALREDKERLDKLLASFYPAVAPIIEHYPIELWEHLEGGRCRGRWAEDGSPYYFTVPHQLVPSFFALQRLAKLAEEKYAARKEAQP